MARRPGLKTMPMSAIRTPLARERENQWDIYAPLSRMRVGIEDSLQSDLYARYHLLVRDGARERKLALSPTSVRQLAGVAGVPVHFLDRLPVSHALKTVRLLMRMMEDSNDRTFLLRLKGNVKSPKCRAVLPNSFIRFDDVELYESLVSVLGDERVKVVSVRVDDDVFYVRFVYGEQWDLAEAKRHEDPAYPGVDIISSETGVYNTEIRYALIRVLCRNGMTDAVEGGNGRRFRKTQMDREVFRSVVRSALKEAAVKGKYMAERLGNTQGEYIENPPEELNRIFAHFRLGSTNGRIGQWVAAELVRKVSLVGVRKFDLINAFTATARGLEPADRMKIEDAMAAYLVNGFGNRAKWLEPN